MDNGFNPQEFVEALYAPLPEEEPKKINKLTEKIEGIHEALRKILPDRERRPFAYEKIFKLLGEYRASVSTEDPVLSEYVKERYVPRFRKVEEVIMKLYYGDMTDLEIAKRESEIAAEQMRKAAEASQEAIEKAQAAYEAYIGTKN